MELKAMEAVFLVTRDTWYNGLESFLEQHRRPEGRLHLEAVHEHFKQQNDSVLVDGFYIQQAFIAELVPGLQPATDNDPPIKVIATMNAWLAGSLILRIRFTVATVSAISDDKGNSEETASSLTDEFVKSLQEAAKPSPVLLCMWWFTTDELLDSITTQDELAPWIEAHVSQEFGDLYASFGTITTILYIKETSPTVTFRWYMPQISFESHSYMLNELRAANIYLATNVLLNKMKAEVEVMLAKVRETVEQENPNPVVPGWLELVASLNPRREDNLRITAGRIFELNRSIPNIQNSITRLESLYSIFHEDWPWQYGSLKLARVEYGRSRLTSIEQGEAGQLTLTEYYHRSGLRIEEFYRHRFDHALQGLLRQLDYLKTIAALRTEQKAAVLNRLILLLTFVTIILAALQILSAYLKCKSLAIVGVILIGAVVIGVFFAGRWSSSHRRRQT